MSITSLPIESAPSCASVLSTGVVTDGHEVAKSIGEIVTLYGIDAVSAYGLLAIIES